MTFFLATAISTAAAYHKARIGGVVMQSTRMHAELLLKAATYYTISTLSWVY